MKTLVLMWVSILVKDYNTK